MRVSILSLLVLVVAVLPVRAQGGASGFDLLPGAELVGVETAAGNVIVLLIRDNAGAPPPSQQPSDYSIDGRSPRQVGRFSATIFEERCVDFARQHYPQILLHRMYLVLDEPLMDGRTYRIRFGDNETQFRFDSRQTFCESLKVNQVGYNPLGKTRRAFFAAWLGDLGGGALPDSSPLRFDVCDSRSGAVVHSGVLGPAIEDAISGGSVYALDLSALDREGEYFVSIPGVGRSYAFGFGDVYAYHAYYVHMKGLYHQRCGVALEQPFTQWTRDACHSSAAVAEGAPFGKIRQAPSSTRPSFGGHHDGSDFDQHLAHPVVAGWLMNAYELFPGKFRDGQLDIPESGNGIPDLLDEALFEIARWECLQEADGAIRAGVEADRHPTYGLVNAASDTLVYRTFRRMGHSTLTGAAIFAHASRLVRPFDAGRADQLLARARLAWQFYTLHCDDPGYSFSRGARLYAACQLYLATGEAEYHEEFLRQGRYFGGLTALRAKWPEQYDGVAYNAKLINEGMVFTHYFVSYLLDESRPRDAQVVEALTAAIVSKADEAVQDLAGSVWPTFAIGSWGQSTAVGRWGDFLMNAYRLTGEQRYLDAACQAQDYVFGTNPPGWCFTTGLGSRPPYCPMHLDSYEPMKRGQGPAPGLVVFGMADPGQAPYVKAVTQHLYPAEPPPGRFITDGWSVAPLMGFTVWETMAPNAFLHACLAPERPLAGRQLPYGDVKIPGGYPRIDW